VSSFKCAVVQAAPEFMRLDACVDKGLDLISQAAERGAELVAFPECWFPGYPWWVWLSPPAGNLQYMQGYHENSLDQESSAFERLCLAAKEHQIFLSIGASERDHGTLYISQFLISNEGKLLQARRKLKPTHVERTVFGEGDGSDLNVVETSLGRIGSLNCWEHLQPLSKYALYSMHEQIHIGAWPSFSCYPEAYSLGAQMNNAVSQVYAVEGQCFVLAPCGVVSKSMIEELVETPDQAELLLAGGGAARIFGPDGRSIADSLAPAEEGLLFAEIDLSVIALAKSFADPVGHYARADVTQLLLNRRPRRPVIETVEEASWGESSEVQMQTELVEGSIEK